MSLCQHTPSKKVQDPSPMEHSSPISRDESQNGVGVAAHSIEYSMFNSGKLQSDLQAMGIKLKQHEDNIKILKSQKNKFDEAIFELQGLIFIIHA